MSKSSIPSIQALDLNLAGLLRANKYARSLIVHDTTKLVDVASNDYLDMACDRGFRQQYLDALAETPNILGSTGSRALSGAHAAHNDLERFLANHMGSQDAVLFSTGWEGNVAFFNTVPQKHDYIIGDTLMHASFYAGVAMSRVPPQQRFKMKHNDPESLAKILRTIVANGITPAKGPKPTVFLVLESIYSMDGDFAPIPALLDTMDMYIPRDQQCNFVDEAHSTALYGDGGRGICGALGPKYRSRIHVRLMTFGKAVGASGSALLMSSMVRLYFINNSMSFIFSTSVAHNVLVAIKTSWDHLKGPEGDRRRQALFDNIVYFNTLVNRLLAVAPPEVLRRPEDNVCAPFPAESGTMLPPHPLTAVVALCTPDPIGMYDFCLERGFYVSAIHPPAVSESQTRVRICLRSSMDRADLDRLAEVMLQYVETQVPSESEPQAPSESVPYQAKL